MHSFIGWLQVIQVIIAAVSLGYQIVPHQPTVRRHSRRRRETNTSLKIGSFEFTRRVITDDTDS
jgi:hypothetical protein